MANNKKVYYGTVYRSDTSIRERCICPLTRQYLLVPTGFYNHVIDIYPYFAESMINYFNAGEQDCNIILKKSIIDFFDKYPELKNKYFVYILSKYIQSFVRCDWGYFYHLSHIFNVIIAKGYLKSAAYQNAPPDFKRFLAEIRNTNNYDYYEGSVYVHNCLIITNRIDNFAYALHDNWDEVTTPQYNLVWLISWLVYNVKQLLEDGLLVLNPDSSDGAGVVVVDDYTQDLIDVTTENKQITGPSRYGSIMDAPYSASDIGNDEDKN
jgi:hypothetical protein